MTTYTEESALTELRGIVTRLDLRVGESALATILGYYADARLNAANLYHPPEGWYTFGTHIDRLPETLEFWGTDAGGMPLWERPQA